MGGCSRVFCVFSRCVVDCKGILDCGLRVCRLSFYGIVFV